MKRHEIIGMAIFGAALVALLTVGVLAWTGTVQGGRTLGATMTIVVLVGGGLGLFIASGRP